MFNKKAQAAMEFLMTYGWAILVVLVAIGALAYFGVLNPSRFLPSSCTLVPGLSCDEFKITGGAAGTSQVELILRNGLGDSIDFSILYIDIDADGAYLDGTDCGFGNAVLDPDPIADGALSEILLFNDCPAIVADSRFRADVRGTYLKGTSTLSREISGLIISQAE